LWSHASSPFPLSSGLNTIYAEFRTASSGSYGYSNPQLTAVDITLNATAPAVYLNSPAGILDPVSSPSQELQQQQYLNSDTAQWITFSGSSSANPSESVTFSIAGCSPCSQIQGASGLTGSMWEWPSSSAAYQYVQVTATDQSGNQASTGTPPNYTGTPPVLSLYSASAAPQEVDCNPSACVTLADQQNFDIPNDQPSLMVENGGTTYNSSLCVMNSVHTLPFAFRGHAIGIKPVQ
jgi:hypothetical protein